MKITKKLTALALSGALCVSLSAQAAAYNDVDPSASYAQAVDALGELGIVRGDGDGSFRPSSTITRGEACALISRILSATDLSSQFSGASDYTDVPLTLWSEPVISYCSELGIVRGDGDGSFRPEDPVTGQEFVTMLCRALNLDDDNDASTAISYPDGYLALGQQAGLLNNVSFDPTAPSLRGDDAQMIYNALYASVDGKTLAQSVFGLSVGTTDSAETATDTTDAATDTTTTDTTTTDTTVTNTTTDATTVSTLKAGSYPAYLVSVRTNAATGNKKTFTFHVFIEGQELDLTTDEVNDFSSISSSTIGELTERYATIKVNSKGLVTGAAGIKQIAGYSQRMVVIGRTSKGLTLAPLTLDSDGNALPIDRASGDFYPFADDVACYLINEKPASDSLLDPMRDLKISADASLADIAASSVNGTDSDYYYVVDIFVTNRDKIGALFIFSKVVSVAK
jgi:hypothetical protein